MEGLEWIFIYFSCFLPNASSIFFPFSVGWDRGGFGASRGFCVVVGCVDWLIRLAIWIMSHLDVDFFYGRVIGVWFVFVFLPH